MHCVCIAVLLLFAVAFVASVQHIEIELEIENVKLDDYYCTAVEVPEKDSESYIVGFTPHMRAAIVHHMLLFGCKGAGGSENTWSCLEKSTCLNGPPETLYAWALQAEGLNLPSGVGFKVGGADGIRYLVMQVHFHRSPATRDDFPKLDLAFTSNKQPFVAGIYLIGRGGLEGLSPGTTNLTVDGSCYFTGPNSITPFAYRTHTHKHGTAMYGYVIKSNQWELIGERNPQDPQAFYPVTNNSIVVNPGDILAARTYYNTENDDSNVHFGPHSDDEMSNFYIMYYMDNNGISLSKKECWSESPPSLLYPDEDPILPVHGERIDHTHIHNMDQVDESEKAPPTITSISNNSAITTTTTTTTTTIATDYVVQVDSSWPYNEGFSGNTLGGILIGDITAVDVDDSNNVYFLHRSNVHWNEKSFGNSGQYLERAKGPITDAVVLKLDSSGSYVSSWGGGVFYLPHSLRVGGNGQYWLTDVARHQILKTENEQAKISVLGEAFVPGTDEGHFCKPADVELDIENGLFYVADGYCNHRVVAYTMKGAFLYQFPSVLHGLQLFVPHSLALSHDGKQLYVADRENGRIVVYDTSTKEGRVFADIRSGLSGAIYAIAFGSSKSDWPLYAINGSLNGRIIVDSDKNLGFTINKDGVVTNTWGPKEGFGKVHDIAVSSDGGYIYVAQLAPASALWRLTVNGTAGLQLSAVPPPPPPPLSTQGNTVSSTAVVSTTSALLLHPSPSTVSSSTSIVLTSQHNIEADDENYSCPYPPPPLTATLLTTSTTTTGGGGGSSRLPSSPSAAISNTSHGLSLYIVLLLIGAVLWAVFICFMCMALLCTRKVRFVAAKQKKAIVKRHYAVDPKRKLQSLLSKSSRKGFTPISVHDDSESDNELTVFQKM